MSAYHVGIDPGASGGIGIIDSRGQFVAAHRWQAKRPALLYEILLSIRGEIFNKLIYLERIQAHPGEGVGHVVNNMALVENYGIWQGFILAAGLLPVLVHPITWQNAHGLASWGKKRDEALKAGRPLPPSPLEVARSRFPGAPLEFLADDGKAVALLLAALSVKDRQAGIDRSALNASREIKAKAQRATARKKRREIKAQAPAPGPGAPLCSALPWPPAPGPRPQNRPAPAPQVAPALDFGEW
jgi:hypothetical protein